MNPAIISKIIKVVLSLLALYGIETSPDQLQNITEGVLAGYAILSAFEAKIKAGQ
jgi:hypothetical protein